MKALLLVAIFMFAGTALAQTETDLEIENEIDSQVLSAAPIDVDGYLKEKKATDGELESLKLEIEKQKKETALNQVKSKSYQELSKSVEKLSETTEEYLEEKKAAQQQIAEYNMKVKCLQADTPGPECDKFVRRRR